MARSILVDDEPPDVKTDGDAQLVIPDSGFIIHALLRGMARSILVDDEPPDVKTNRNSLKTSIIDLCIVPSRVNDEVLHDAIASYRNTSLSAPMAFRIPESGLDIYHPGILRRG
eukprot:CAMPEP_0170199504 /NCGR_PEP_ID=MMETSP0040_2-20121228/69376_1 /TAXON_ID=641309 /ORGANISM="Lotharella oceanica, Strain CCMP622" /LENGTH=113 /DNA_ID=CAMNT_0010449633 /DNA_START=450 /DNA_END=791 /DNA_ORIENTATION=+